MDTPVTAPFLLPVELAMTLMAFVIAMLAGVMLGRRRAVSILPVLTGMAVVGLVSARMLFALQFPDAFTDDPLSLINISDGGLHAGAGLLGAALFGLFGAWHQPEIRAHLAVAVLAGALGAGVGSLSLRQTPLPETPLPPIQLETLDAELVNLATFDDLPMVINLWATWCLPCRREMPLFAEIQQRETGVRFVFINQGESLEQILDYLHDHDLALENVLRDPASVATRLFRTRGLPGTYFFDANGMMVDAHVGELSRAALNRKLRNL